MHVIIRPTARQAVDFVARILLKKLKNKPDTVLGLATGRTMEQVYARLVASTISFAHCQTFNLDEYTGLAPDHPCSYRHYMKTHLFDHININQANTHFPDAHADDIKIAALDYEKKITSAGGIDLQLLGIGANGHIAFNEPLSSFTSRTRVITLTPVTRVQNAEFFGGIAENVPRRALTMGVGTILEARELVLLATGLNKAEMIRKAVEGPMTAKVSASALQLHPNCRVVLDEPAASQLYAGDHHDFASAAMPD